MPRKREMTRKVIRKITKYTEKARNSKKPILMFRIRVIVRMMFGTKTMTSKMVTIRRSI